MKFPDIPIYVITVRSFHGRHEHIKSLAANLGFKFEFIYEFDADSLSAEDWSRVDNSMHPRSVSNVLKHIEAQRRLLTSGAPLGLVLEDDVLMFDSFTKKLHSVLELASELDEGWLIFLGGADNKIDERFILAERLELIPKPISTAEAYLIDYVGCRKRLKWLENNLIDRQADHQLKLIDESINVPHFWVSEPMATQGSITGLFPTALDKSRAKHGPKYLVARYQFNRWRRQILPRYWARLVSSRGKNA